MLHTVKAPDGRIIKVEAPADAAEADLIAFAQKNSAPAPAPAEDYSPTGGMSTGEKFIAGAGSALADKWLGARQLAANLPVVGKHLGDADALAAEAAEKKRLDAPLLDTGAGRAGDIVGSVAPEMMVLAPSIGVGALRAGARFLPGVVSDMAAAAGNVISKSAPALTKARAIPGRFLPSFGASVAQGAADSLLAPEEGQYDIGKKSLVGAGVGGAADLATRGALRAITPLTSIAPEVRAQVQRLRSREQGGVPTLLAANTTGSPAIEAMTSAVEKLPILGAPIAKARRQNSEWLTEQMTGAAGSPSKTAGAGAADIFAPLDAQARAFRSTPATVTLAGLTPAERRAVRANVGDEALTAAGATQAGNIADIERRAAETATALDAARAATKSATHGDAFSMAKALEERAAADAAQAAKQLDLAQAVPTQHEFDMNQAFDLRRRLSEKAWRTNDELRRDSYLGARDKLDEQLHGVLGDGDTSPFASWLKKWGAAEDVRAASVKGPPGGGPIKPENSHKTLEARQAFAPTTPLEQDIVALAARTPRGTPPGGGDAALRLASLLAGGAAAGGLAGGGDLFSGAGAGAGAALPLAALLLGTKTGGRYLGNSALSPAARAAWQRALTSGIVAGQ